MRLGPILALVAALVPAIVRAEGSVLVFAASSLQTALDRVAADWQAEGGAPVVISYGASSALARQIEAGAPADIVFSASEEWMERLDDAGLLRAGTRTDLLGNALVLIRPGPGDDLGEIGPGFDLATMLAGGRLAIALTDAVPAGIYGREALVSLGLWDEVDGRLAETDDVRAALALVAAGAAPLGVVYATDAKAEPAVSVVGRFPEASHVPIRYPVALTAASGATDAASFHAYLASAPARARFEAEGFTWLGLDR